MADPSTEDLQQLRDQLRAEIREARETLKDLRYEIREARKLRDTLTDDFTQRMETEVTEQLADLGKHTRQAMEDSVTRVINNFDQVHDILLGQDPESRRSGRTPIPELLRAKHTLDTARDQP